MSAAQAQAQQAQGTGPIAPVGPIRQGTDSSAQRQIPTPAARSLNIEPGATDQVRADTHTLSSIENLGMGSLSVVRSFVDPSFVFTQLGDSGITPGNKSSSTSLGVNLSFDRNTSRSSLTGFYGGAQVLYHPDSSNNTMYHKLAVSQEIRWARWGLRLRDDLLISPEASFGGLDIGGLGLSGGANTLQPSVGVSDTILTQRARRLSNAASGEINYSFSRRSIVTLAGSYASLHFMEPGYIDSRRITGRVGFDYALAPKDSVAVFYDYRRTDFSPTSDRLQTDSFQLSYGRKVTGRLALQIAAGPQLLHSSLRERTLDWTLSGAMTYQTRRNVYSLSYSRGPSSGSGVFLGANSHTVTASMRNALTQSWTSSLSAGYAFDQNLAPVNGVVSHFDNWYANAGLGREIGRHVRFDLTYRFQRQGAGAGTCPVLACGSTQLRQTLGVTLYWHPWSITPR
jgi:hypothetical protein